MSSVRMAGGLLIIPTWTYTPLDELSCDSLYVARRRNSHKRHIVNVHVGRTVWRIFNIFFNCSPANYSYFLTHLINLQLFWGLKGSWRWSVFTSIKPKLPAKHTPLQLIIIAICAIAILFCFLLGSNYLGIE